MHTAVFHVALLWQVGLGLILAVQAMRTRSVAERMVTVEALIVLLVTALGMLAIRREEAGYLDIALVVGMLGFTQSVGALRLVEGAPEVR